MQRRTDGRYQLQRTIDGKIVSFYSSANTEKTAKSEINKQFRDYKANLHRQKHNFKQISDRMLDEREQQVSYNTNLSYRYAFGKLDLFYDRDIEDIAPIEMQRRLIVLANEGYSRSGVQKVKIVIGLIYKFAILEGLDVQNVAATISIPKNAAKGERHSADDYTIKCINDNVGISDVGMWAYMLLYTGMRRGELAVIQKADIDFDNATINVCKSAEYIGNNCHVKPVTKTKSGMRHIPILDNLRPILKDYVKNMHPSDFVFGGKKPLSETMVKKRWKKYCTDVGIDITQHQLRHNFAKMLYQSGVDAKTAQGLLGHADVTTTLNIYTDFSKDVTLQSVSKINKFLRNA